jgi:hypothetical protein
MRKFNLVGNEKEGDLRHSHGVQLETIGQCAQTSSYDATIVQNLGVGDPLLYIGVKHAESLYVLIPALNATTRGNNSSIKSC